MLILKSSWWSGISDFQMWIKRGRRSEKRGGLIPQKSTEKNKGKND